MKTSKDEADGTLKAAVESHQKEVKKLKDQMIALENTSKISGKGDKEKDKLISLVNSSDNIILSSVFIFSKNRLLQLHFPIIKIVFYKVGCPSTRQFLL